MLRVKPREFDIPIGYYLIKSNLFSSIDGWKVGMPWGDVHPDNDRVNMGHKDVVKIDNNRLDCSVLYDSLNDEYHAGTVYYNRPFRYGIFSCDICAPIGCFNHGSFWLYGVNSWPPEIDIMETYNDACGLTRKVQPNLWWKTFYGTQEKKGAYSVGVVNPNKWHNYTLWWEKDFVKIYYDGYLVCEYTDKIPIQYMYLVFSNNIDCDKMQGDYTGVKSPMRFKNLKIYKKYE